MDVGLDAEDDPIVREMNVFVSTQLREQLYLFQYPLRDAQRPVLHDQTYAEVRFKPSAQAVELKVPLAVNSENYDAPRGEGFAERANIQYEEAPVKSSKSKLNSEPEEPKYKEKTFVDNIMDYHVLSSTRAPSTKQYAIGLVRHGEVHLTAVSGVLQLRPSFSHIDEGDKREAAAEKASKSADKSDEPAAAPKATTIKMQVTKAESAKAAAIRKRSYAHFQQQIDDEPWVDLTYSHSSSDIAVAKRQQLAAEAQNPINFPLEGPDYLARMHEADAASMSTNATRNNHPTMMLTTLAEMRTKPLGEGLRLLLRQAQVLHYQHALTLTNADNEHMLLEQLPGLAMLIQGCWVARSALIYPEGIQSYYNGLEPSRLVLARDFLLWRFHYGAPIKREELMAVGRVPDEEATQMLEQLAVKHSSEFGWVLKLKRDEVFIKEQTAAVKAASRDFIDFERKLMRDLDLSHSYKTDMVALAKRIK